MDEEEDVDVDDDAEARCKCTNSTVYYLRLKAASSVKAPQTREPALKPLLARSMLLAMVMMTI